MTRLKKVLSIVLCLSMLLGTLTVGLMFASAEGEEPSAAIPTYEELAANEGSFYYAGVEVYEGNELSDGALASGSTVQFKYYCKSNLDLYRTTNFLIIDNIQAVNLDDEFITDVTPGRTTATDKLKVTRVEGSSKINQAKFYNNSNNSQVYITKPDGSSYTAAEIDKWLILKINDTDNNPHDITGDNPFVTFNINFVAGFTGSVNVFMVTDSFTAASGTKNTNGVQYLGGKSATPKVDNFILQPSQSFEFSNEVKFLNADGSVIETQTPEKGDAIVPPEVEDLYKWADADGNFVDLSGAKMGDVSLTYTAVLNSTTVELTLNGNGGLIDGEETKTVNVPVSQTLDLSRYSASKDGDSFKGWAVNGIVTEQYTFTKLAPVAADAVWENSALLKVLIGTSEGKWEEYVEYVGTPGEALTQETYDAINSAVAEEFAKSGMSAIGCEEQPVYNGLQYIEGVDSTIGAYLVDIDKYAFENIIFGETPFLFISAKFVQTVNYYYPNTNEDGTVIENSWNKYKTETYDFNSYLDAPDYDENEPGDLEKLSCRYTSGAGKKYNPDVVGGGDGVLVNVGNLQRFENDENSKYIYTSIFKDGNGTELVPDNYGAFTLPTSGYTEPGIFDVYTYPKDRVFAFGFDAGNNNYQVVDKEYAIGDTLVKEDLESCYKSSSTSTKYSVSDLLEDCTVIGKPGYKLVDIWFGSDESTEETSILSGNSVTLTKEMVESALTVDGKEVIILSCSFDTIPFEFIVKYKDAQGNWQELTSKTFSGNANVTYASLIDADLEKIVADNAPTGEVPLKGSFTVESTGATKSSFYAYEGPITLQIQYMSDVRTAFIDFNNGKDGVEIGYQMNANLKYGAIIHDPNYDPSAKDENGEAIKPPYFTGFINGVDSEIPSKTIKVQDIKNGEPVYEPLYKDKVDDNGNVVIDPVTGKPEQERVYEDVLDKDGKPMYDEKTGDKIQQPAFDKSKPVYVDPKGATIKRPYRACEYMGTKVYHLDTVVRNWSDMPAQSEWKEGYENDEYRIYNTAILQLQWKSDADFLFRVYDNDGFSISLPINGASFGIKMNGNIYSALGKDLKWYYWNGDKPCKKGEGKLNADPESQIILLFWPKREVLELGTDENGNPITSNGWIFEAVSIGKTWFKPSFIPDFIPILLPAIKGLLN